jgi:FMN reductase
MARELKIVTLIGNPKPASRTLDVGKEIAGQIVRTLAQRGMQSQSEFVDIATLGAGLLDWASKEVTEVVERTLAADLLIVATPTYKATYTGLLKLFLDRIQQNALLGRVAIPVMVAATPLHGLAGETHLRPLLVELGATCPTRAFFVLESQLEELPAIVGKWLETYGAVLMTVLSARVPQ